MISVSRTVAGPPAWPGLASVCLPRTIASIRLGSLAVMKGCSCAAGSTAESAASGASRRAVRWERLDFTRCVLSWLAFGHRQAARHAADPGIQAVLAPVSEVDEVFQ